VVLILDTLRLDFECLCSEHGVPHLESLSLLRGLGSPLPGLKCGSFPTVPMRTDLLTGKLAFLSRRWATPEEDEPVLTSHLASFGVHSCLVTDNYMMVEPQLGGVFAKYFDETIRIRGTGSDPWQEPIPGLQDAQKELPGFSPVRIAQYVANTRAWARCGGPPWQRLFASAKEVLVREMHRERGKFLLWVDSFATHEPWYVPPSTDMSREDMQLIAPIYGDAKSCSVSTLMDMRRTYALRVRDVDAAMCEFSDALAGGVQRGDVALVLLSDHGFYFGEFGLIGKPVWEPVLPPLHELVGVVSEQLTGRLPAAPLQPHRIAAAIAHALGGPEASAPFEAAETQGYPQVVGRNSPNVGTILFAFPNGFLLGFRDSQWESPLWFDSAGLDDAVPWREQGTRSLPNGVLSLVRGRSSFCCSPWAGEFHLLRQYLGGAAHGEN